MDTLTLINRAHQGDKLARDKILIENKINEILQEVA